MVFVPESTLTLHPIGIRRKSTSVSSTVESSLSQWNEKTLSLNNASFSPNPVPFPIHSHETPENLLVVSPYRTLLHLLNLQTVSKPYQLLAKALTLMQAVRPDYATAPYAVSFNWQEISQALADMLKDDHGYQWEREELYVIIFRSQVPESKSRSRLLALDQLAHAEAMASGGLLKYWYGIPDASGRNLATCIWRAREDARKGGAGQGHKQAMKETMDLYTEWHVERLRLVVDEGGRSWSFENWKD